MTGDALQLPVWRGATRGRLEHSSRTAGQARRDAGPIIRTVWRPRDGDSPANGAVAVGTVESPLTDRTLAPKQGDEGAPDAWLVFDERVADALDGIVAGDDLLC